MFAVWQHTRKKEVAHGVWFCRQSIKNKKKEKIEEKEYDYVKQRFTKLDIPKSQQKHLLSFYIWGVTQLHSQNIRGWSKWNNISSVTLATQV